MVYKLSYCGKAFNSLLHSRATCFLHSRATCFLHSRATCFLHSRATCFLHRLADTAAHAQARSDAATRATENLANARRMRRLRSIPAYAAAEQHRENSRQHRLSIEISDDNTSSNTSRHATDRAHDLSRTYNCRVGYGGYNYNQQKKVDICPHNTKNRVVGGGGDAIHGQANDTGTFGKKIPRRH